MYKQTNSITPTIMNSTMPTTSQQQPSNLIIMACFAALRDYKSRKPTKPLSQWMRKGIPRSIWCGTKTVFDQREATPKAFLDENSELQTLEKPKRKYVKKTPEEKAALALKPKRKYVKKTPEEKAALALKPKRKYTKKVDLMPYEINVRTFFEEPAAPKRKYVKKTPEEKAALALKPKRKYTKKTAEQRAIASLKPIIANVIQENTATN